MKYIRHRMPRMRYRHLRNRFTTSILLCVDARAGSAARLDHGECTGGYPALRRVGSASEHDRDPSTQYDAGAFGMSEIDELFVEHVAGFEIGHDQDVGTPPAL